MRADTPDPSGSPSRSRTYIQPPTPLKAIQFFAAFAIFGQASRNGSDLLPTIKPRYIQPPSTIPEDRRVLALTLNAVWRPSELLIDDTETGQTLRVTRVGTGEFSFELPRDYELMQGYGPVINPASVFVGRKVELHALIRHRATQSQINVGRRKAGHLFIVASDRYSIRRRLLTSSKLFVGTEAI